MPNRKQIIDFRGEERRQKGHSFWLLTLYLPAVLYYVVLVYPIARFLWLILAGFAWQIKWYGISDRPPIQAPPFWDLDAFAWSAVFTLSSIVIVTVIELLILKWRGGHMIAKRLGGRPVDPATTNPDERRLLNVVGEMALATGLPEPAVYILRKQYGINAFSAGYTPRKAVICATAGCAKMLTRDELQGVIAHEFSHIKNGDIRLDLRLVALLQGIMALGLFGAMLMEPTITIKRRDLMPSYEVAARERLWPIMLLMAGIGFLFLGMSCVANNLGRRIRNAVSYHREMLADAAAVEYSRHPAGLAGALVKIGGLNEGSHLFSAIAPIYSHLFFADAVSMPGYDEPSSHPDLRYRIFVLDPQWDGKFVDPLPGLFAHN